MTYINITSVKLFVKVQNIFGVFKVFACLIVIGGGIYEIAKGMLQSFLNLAGHCLSLIKRFYRLIDSSRFVFFFVLFGRYSRLQLVYTFIS